MSANSFWTPNRLQRYVNEGLIRRRNQTPAAGVAANRTRPASAPAVRLASGVYRGEPITIEPAPGNNGVARLGARPAARLMRNVPGGPVTVEPAAANNGVARLMSPEESTTYRLPTRSNSSRQGGKRKTRKGGRRASKKSRRVNRK